MPKVPPSNKGRGHQRVERLQESKVKKKALGLAAFLIVAASIVNAFFGERGVLGLIEANKNFEELEREVHFNRVEERTPRAGDPRIANRRVGHRTKSARGARHGTSR